jgi:glycosyltransferase involved in cell wall biosynthesis
MKIVQIVTQMEAAGAQRVAYLLHEGLRRRGHETELWFLYLKRPAYSGKSGVRVLSNRRPSLLGYFLLAIKLFGWIRTYKPDVLITHTHYANVLSQLLGAVAGVRQRVSVQHNILATYPTFARYADWLLGTVGIYTKQVAVSHSVTDSMSAYPKRYKKNVQTIYNGIELIENSCPSGQPLLNLPADYPRILHVGRLSREKNHEVLLKSLQQIPGAYLVLVGNGELRGTLTRQVHALGLADRVRFMGEITPEQVRAVMNRCDLFIFPSLYEAMPMALIEAMAAGMPIVASDIPAHREVLQGTGILLSPTPQELSRAANRLLSDTSYAEEMGRKAAERAKTFSVDAMVDGYERLMISGMGACLPKGQGVPRCETEMI